MAKALAESGRLAEAIEQVRAAVQLNPDPQLVNVLTQLEAMAPAGTNF